MKTMTKLSAILLAASICAAWPALAQTSATQPTAPPTTTNAPPKPRATTYGGTIASVDAATMTVTLRSRPGNPETKVKITHDTKIKMQNEPAQFTDLAEGLRIRGSGKKGDDGVWTANTLNILPKATPKPATATPAAPKPPE